jgi:aromatic-L-amino-acid decarboxylase
VVNLDLNREERILFLASLWSELETFYTNTEELRVSPKLDRKNVIEWIECNIHSDASTLDRAKDVINGLKQFAVHTGHPDYFGLFNPRSSFAGIVADLITATMNPQMAAWSHAPLAIEIENYLVQELAKRFGFQIENADGVFCSGGAEANLTAVLCAVTKSVENFKSNGLLGVTKRPIIYCSEHAHHSIARAARIVGLGHDSVVSIKTDDDLRIIPQALDLQIRKDIEQGSAPIMIVATAGTTGPGSIDQLEEIGIIARDQNLWFHVDGAYGAAIILNENYKSHLKGIEQADSITFDIHKWLAVPMAASVFITSTPDILEETFGMHADYMPRDSQGMKVIDPYMHSIQWSRRFIGLKLYMSVLFYGWDGIAALVENYIILGEEFRSAISSKGWNIINSSPLPVICFVDEQAKGERNNSQQIVSYILETGEAWLSIYPIDGVDTIRVCINNHMTASANINKLVQLLGEARSSFT